MIDATPRRLLPFDVDLGVVRTVGATASRDRPPSPPTYVELVEAGLVAPGNDPDLSFNSAERSLAEWLRQRGLKVLSVQRRLGTYERTPDAALPEHQATVELKRATTSLTAMVRSVRLGRGQSRRVLIDSRGQGGDVGWALTSIATAVRYYGAHLDEIVVVLSDDQSVGWWHGRDAGVE